MKILIPGSKAAFLLTLVILWLPQGVRAAVPSGDDTGVIRGTVRILEKLTEQRMRFRLYPGLTPAPPSAEPGARDDEWRNIVIYLKSVPPGPHEGSVRDKKLSMAQQGETFIPHVLPIVVGSTVEFPNLDPIFHNVFSLSGTETFDLGRYPQGDSRSVTFDQVGIVPVFCHIHSDMGAIIMVLENPYFTVPGADGQYQIEDIPPGIYTLVAWHERSEPVEIQVVVEAGQVLDLNLTVPIEIDDISRQ